MRIRNVNQQTIAAFETAFSLEKVIRSWQNLMLAMNKGLKRTFPVASAYKLNQPNSVHLTINALF
ncbi:hypothetical protein ATN88_07180 [Enterovibrio coralii]|uniref:Uncharacterized protein n=1 Tax=Enterovibrio coralii TaxID=294935 RepID=A0A135ID82_9GAMM|nr:hypothetical protein ATN88_07180 [Enterovibrio coralii]